VKDRLIGFAIVGLVVAAYGLFIEPAVDRHDRKLEEQQRQKQEQLYREQEDERLQEWEQRRRACQGLPADSGCWG
jgi:hypothetical protein